MSSLSNGRTWDGIAYEAFPDSAVAMGLFGYGTEFEK